MKAAPLLATLKSSFICSSFFVDAHYFLGLPQFGGQVSGPDRFEFTGADELLLVSDPGELPDR
jgi:hypothetical protein